MRSLSGDLSPEEARVFAESLANNPALRHERDLLSRAWQAGAMDSVMTPEELATDRARILSRVQRQGLVSSKPLADGRLLRRSMRTPRAIMPRTSRTGHWGAVLAGPVIALGCLVYVWHRTVGADRITPQHAHVYTTAVAKEATVTLADGSRVTLAPQSTLRVDQNFGHGTRTVTLEGEAFFEVPNHRDVPLVVRTGGLTTRVLGTRFDVRHYAQDHTAQIVVVEGKVMVSGKPVRAAPSGPETSLPGGTMVLAAGMMGRVTDTTAIATAMPDGADYARWTQGVLVFRRAPLPDVLATIGHWYGLTFRLADSTLATQHLTATFDHRSLEDILATIGVLLDVSMTSDSTNVVTLHAGRPLRSAAPARNIPDARLSPHKEIGR